MSSSGTDLRDRNKAGLNLVKWDLRVQPLRPLPPAPGAPPAAAGGGGGGGGFGGGGNNGPYVLPGTYRATLNVNGRDAQTIDVAVKGDPLIQITDADRRAWHETARDLHALQLKANDVAEMVQNAFAQVQLLQQQTRNQTLSPNVKQQLDDVVKEFEVGAAPPWPGSAGWRRWRLRRQHREPARADRAVEGPGDAVDGRSRPTRR